MKKSGVYTRTGDAGMTSLVGGTRVPKTHPRLEAYGTVDELSAHIGLLVTYVDDMAERNRLLGMQHKLFAVGAYLATEGDRGALHLPAGVTTLDVEAVERAIDEVDAGLPSLRAFILPGGGRAAAVCHVCRTVCRRAERCILALGEEAVPDAAVVAYVNRLSDYFFVLARKLNKSAGVDELIWQKSCD